MLVSFIIPTYNGEKYIDQCINTLQSQKYQNWEAIFINDGSTDNTLTKLKYAVLHDQRIKVYSQKNQGAAIARNYGIKKAHGEFYSFLDVDDTLSENFLSVLLQNLNEDIDIVAGTFNIIRNNSIIKKTQSLDTTMDNTEFLKFVLCGKCGWELCGKLYRKNLFSYKIITPENIRIGEDASVYIQLVSNAKKIRILNKALYNYIQYNSSASHTKSESMAEETLKAGFFIESILKEKQFYNKIKNEISTMFLLFFSNSSRKAFLGMKNKLVLEIYQKHFTIKALRNIPIFKRIYIIIYMYLGQYINKII